jgi:pyruvate carboxylase subunit B
MKTIRFMDVSFRDGFQSVLGARVKTADFLPALQAAVAAGTRYIEIGGGARFQSPYFYCQEDAFESMDTCRATVGADVNLQTLARGINVVGLMSQPSDIIKLHAVLFKKHGMTTIRNFDALNDVRNLDYSGRCIVEAGLKHQIAITLMGLPPNMNTQAHTAAFYVDRLKDILKAGIPFHSVAFKDASGTCTPRVVFDTIKQARQLLPADTDIQFHTHDTAGLGIACNLAAIEGGADVIDVSMAPLSSGTCAPDILTLWHALKGSEYTLDIDYEKYLKAEEVFTACMERYFLPPEAKETNPLITLSPMPGGALTANTQMMRDQKCLDKFPLVIKAMREVVERGGFGTSVTPVSQFYFQQAFNNVMLGPWKKIAEGYGKMVLGYFGRTPSAPDAEIVKIAAEQLALAPTAEDPRLINDANPNLGAAVATRKLAGAGLPVSDENVFIVACCSEGKTDKGLDFLKGNRPAGIRYKDAEVTKPAGEGAKAAPAASAAAATTADKGPSAYDVTVNNVTYRVQVATAGAGAAPQVTSIQPAAPAVPIQGTDIKAPMPGGVLRLVADVGAVVKDGDTLVVIEAMKMEQEIKSTVDGTVLVIEVAVGDTVDTDQVVAVVG